MLKPYISGSDVVICGDGDLAVGIRYDEVNMFTPIIMMMEKDLPSGIVKTAASESGVPVLANDALVKNLFRYGKPGNTIPDLCVREIAAILAREKIFVKSDKKTSARPPRPIKIEMGAALMDFLKDEKTIEEGLGMIGKRLSSLFGYRFPSIIVSGGSSSCAASGSDGSNGSEGYAGSGLRGGEYRVLIKGIEAGRGSIDLGWFNTVDLGFDPAQIQTAVRTVAAVLINHIGELIQKRTPELLGRDEVQAILDRAEKKYPVVTGEVKALLSLGSVRDIFRGLLSEQVSIRHMPVILETLADWAGYGPTPNELIIEQIRQSLKRQICLEYTDDKQTLRVLTLETGLEQNFSDKVMLCESGLISSGSADEWLEAFSPAIAQMEKNGLKPVILCSPVARSWVKEFTRMKFPNLAVLSYVEIPPDIKVEPVGEIALERGRKRFLND